MFKVEKRINNGWGGRINYTYSRLKDNQFGESNFFSQRRPPEAQNIYNLEDEYAVEPARRAAQARRSSPIIELPFGEGKRWATSGVAKRDPRRLDDLVDHLDRERLPGADSRRQQQH